MAASAKIQRTDMLEASERHGITSRVVMRSRVVNLTDTSYLTLFTALATAGIPAAGTLLTGAPTLVLTERNPRLVVKGTVDVDLVYEKFNNEGQSIDSPPTGIMTGVVRANVQQITTNLDKNGNTVTVSHTWASDDPDTPGRTDVQGGEFQAFIPQRTLSVEGIKDSNRPWVLANSIIGSINSAPFSGEASHEWMCVSVSWDIQDATNGSNRYHMIFEFQHNPDTWNPSVVFIDPRSGKPPKDLLEDVGYKTVRVHPEKNFEAIIGTRIQGA